jgi:dUTPase
MQHTIKLWHRPAHTDDTLPRIKYAGDAGLDLACPHDVILIPNQPILIKSGVWVRGLDAGLCLHVLPKSSSVWLGIQVLTGTVDSNYGEDTANGAEIGISILPFRHGSLRRGEFIAQLVPNPFGYVRWYLNERLVSPEFGERGSNTSMISNAPGGAIIDGKG